MTRQGHPQKGPKFRHRTSTLVTLVAVLALMSAFIAFMSVTPGQAATLVSSDGITSLSTIGTVTAGTPYSSGQTISITGIANSVMDNTSLGDACVPGQYTPSTGTCPSGTTPSGNATGNFYIEECTDPGGLAANLPTSGGQCENATLDVSVSKTNDGSFSDSSYQLFDLPDPGTLGPADMTGSCDVAPNQCVIGIFATDPHAANGFNYPHLFSAPFNIDKQSDFGSGRETGLHPGDGSAPTITSTSATNSTVVASPTTVVADGANTATVTVTLKDTNGNPVTAGKSVTLSQGTGHSTIAVNGSTGSTTTSNGSGQAIFTVSDNDAESVTYTATDTTDDVTVSQTPSVTFSAPTASAANSSISATNSSVPQSGSTTITVTLMDQGVLPQPIAGKLISLSQGAGSSSITPASTGSATTSAQGKATFTVSDAKAETVTYSASDSTDGVALTGQSASVTFGTLVVSATDSTVTTSTPVVATSTSSVSQTSGTVDVTLLSGTSPVDDKTVELSSSSTTAVIYAQLANNRIQRCGGVHGERPNRRNGHVQGCRHVGQQPRTDGDGPGGLRGARRVRLDVGDRCVAERNPRRRRVRCHSQCDDRGSVRKPARR